ncbi:hypothetical protein JD793_002791 [Citrobacter braakii]|nr:hypothetical protein [Citrobacter braakii]
MAIKDNDPDLGKYPVLRATQLKACLYFLLVNHSELSNSLGHFLIYPNNDTMKAPIGIKVDEKYIHSGSLRDALHNAIKSLKISDDEKKNIFRTMYCSAGMLTLTNYDLAWITDDKRACYWLWLHLMHEKTIELGNENISIVKAVFSVINNNIYPSETDRLNMLTESFHSAIISVEDKKHLLIYFKQLWNEFIVKQPSIRWIDQKNKDMGEFLWRYLKKDGELISALPHYFSLLHTDSESYSSFIAALDFCALPESNRKLFVIRAQKAWHQHKLREKQKKEKRKAINISISDDAKRKLTNLAKQNNTTMGKMIEQLILNASAPSSPTSK